MPDTRHATWTHPAEAREAELKTLKNEIHEFGALHPNRNEWPPEKVADYDSLTQRHTCAEFAELLVRRPATLS